MQDCYSIYKMVSQTLKSEKKKKGATIQAVEVVHCRFGALYRSLDEQSEKLKLALRHPSNLSRIHSKD